MGPLKAKVRLRSWWKLDFGRERENGPIRRPLGRQSLDSGFRHNEKKSKWERETPWLPIFVISRLREKKMEHKNWNGNRMMNLGEHILELKEGRVFEILILKLVQNCEKRIFKFKFIFSIYFAFSLVSAIWFFFSMILMFSMFPGNFSVCGFVFQTDTWTQ